MYFLNDKIDFAGIKALLKEENMANWPSLSPPIQSNSNSYIFVVLPASLL
jgi:hypothetical protein